ncbi:hypothetical protein [Streptomyces albireticuli]|uniref:hypothetical protein n=1 Tax=Streptomyces albireticuli TaxID=1940 RepID=UPI0036848D6E
MAASAQLLLSGLTGAPCPPGPADAPLTSEPPLAAATPLTSEPPLTTEPPLTSEPAVVAASGTEHTEV